MSANEIEIGQKFVSYTSRFTRMGDERSIYYTSADGDITGQLTIAPGVKNDMTRRFGKYPREITIKMKIYTRD